MEVFFIATMVESIMANCNSCCSETVTLISLRSLRARVNTTADTCGAGGCRSFFPLKRLRLSVGC